ncbi:MAG: hypothetical protein SO108_05690 [Bacilli bacterium]|nr:hypothetical protein [Bacilli bacterium]
MKKRKKKTFLSSFERLIYQLFAFIIILLIVGIVCSETSLAQMNLDIQKLDSEVEKQRKRIESLNMKIDEMTSLDNIKEISERYGLTYHSENIKTIK